MNSPIANPLAQNAHIRFMDAWQDTIPEDIHLPPATFEILFKYFEGSRDFLIYLLQKRACYLGITSQHLANINMKRVVVGAQLKPKKNPLKVDVQQHADPQGCLL